MVIDLHDMNRNEAIRFFISKYNEAFKNGFKDEITVIHGYGSSGKGGVIKKEFKEFLDLHKNHLSFRTDANPGATIILPKKKIQELQDKISLEVLEYCKNAPRNIDKIKGNFFKKYTNQEINSCVKRLVKKELLVVILKKNGDTYRTKGE